MGLKTNYDGNFQAFQTKDDAHVAIRHFDKYILGLALRRDMQGQLQNESRILFNYALTSISPYNIFFKKPPSLQPGFSLLFQAYW
jgi:hypothetical protein